MVRTTEHEGQDKVKDIMYSRSVKEHGKLPAQDAFHTDRLGTGGESFMAQKELLAPDVPEEELVPSDSGRSG